MAVLACIALANDNQARAGAVDALGLLLAPPTPRGRLTGSSNFLLFPPWVAELVQCTL